MPRRVMLLSFAFLTGLVGQQPPPTAFVDVTVVPMDQERLMPHQTVVIQGGRITAIGPVRQIPLSRDVRRIDGRGKYLLPGLGDMHVHFTVNTLAMTSAIYERFALLLVANGVTTFRNMRGTPDVLALRKQIDAGMVLGPTVYTAGLLNDGNPPVRPTARIVETPAQAVEAVAADKQAGYDAVKISDNLLPATYSALVSAARQQGLPVYGHVPLTVGLRAVLDAHQDSVEHLDGYDWVLQADTSPYKNGASTNVLPLDRFEHIDLGALPEWAQATRKAGTWNCPTIVTYQKLAISPDQSLRERQRPEIKYLPSDVLAAWQPGGVALGTRRRSPEDYAYLTKRVEIVKQIVKGLHKEGARLLAGTDMPVAWVVPGFSLIQELQNFVDAGLSPYDAIKAATSDAAEFLNKSSEFGRVALGVRADLLLVDANPLQNVSNVSRRVGVMVRGKWLPEAELRNRLYQSTGNAALLKQ